MSISLNSLELGLTEVQIFESDLWIIQFIIQGLAKKLSRFWYEYEDKFTSIKGVLRGYAKREKKEKCDPQTLRCWIFQSPYIYLFSNMWSSLLSPYLMFGRFLSSISIQCPWVSHWDGNDMPSELKQNVCLVIG